MEHHVEHDSAESDQRRSPSPLTAPDRSRAARATAPPLILIVDDDESSRQAVATLLELDGYRVAAAGDGREALDLLESGLQPALILLDMNMPRMDGVAFRHAQQCRPALSDIPVIVCSGCMEDEERLAALGSVIFLRKPLSIDRFQNVVHEQCPL